MKNKKTTSEIYLTKADPNIKYNGHTNILGAIWLDRITKKIEYVYTQKPEKWNEMCSKIEKIVDEYLPITDVNP